MMKRKRSGKRGRRKLVGPMESTFHALERGRPYVTVARVRKKAASTKRAVRKVYAKALRKIRKAGR